MKQRNLITSIHHGLTHSHTHTLTHSHSHSKLCPQVEDIIVSLHHKTHLQVELNKVLQRDDKSASTVTTLI